jgi:hypothetical protein
MRQPGGWAPRYTITTELQHTLLNLAALKGHSHKKHVHGTRLPHNRIHYNRPKP